MSQPIRGQGGHLVFPIGPKNTNLVEDVEILLPVKFSLNSLQWLKRRSRKMSQPIRGQDGHLVFPIGLKNTNLVEDIKILLPVKFRWISFSGFRGEVENVSANQRPGRPSCFSDLPKKHKLGKGRWDLASCQVLLNSVQRFQRRSRKCEKLTTDDGRTDRRTTDDGQRVITIVHLSLRLRCTKKTLVLFHSSVFNTYIRLEHQKSARFTVLSIRNTHRAKEKRFVFRFWLHQHEKRKTSRFPFKILTLKRMLRSPRHWSRPVRENNPLAQAVLPVAHD